MKHSLTMQQRPSSQERAEDRPSRHCGLANMPDFKHPRSANACMSICHSFISITKTPNTSGAVSSPLSIKGPQLTNGDGRTPQQQSACDQLVLDENRG
eukprot:82242-Pelagomonas_calceolata.AAC.4